MIDPKILRNNPETVRKKWKERGFDTTKLDEYLQLDKVKREILTTVENLKKKTK